MKKITVSAPGKLVLFGEHAVVYGRPCIVTAVDQRMYITIELTKKREFQLKAPEVSITNYKKNLAEIGKGDIPREAKFVEIAVKNLFDSITHAEFISGIKVSTKSEFSAKLGFGSSSASAVCTVKALSEIFDLKLTNKQIFDISYKTILDTQKKGSGIDVAAAVFGGTLYFVTAGKVIEQLPANKLPLIVGYSGIKADTITLINQVKERFKNKQKQLNEIYDEIEILVKEARQALVENNFDLFGQLMNVNQRLLYQLGVSIKKLDTMIDAAKDAGSYGAKLSGAGGGDCMIAIYSQESKKNVERAIIKAGGEVIKVNTNAEGVKIEYEG